MRRTEGEESGTERYSALSSLLYVVSVTYRNVGIVSTEHMLMAEIEIRRTDGLSYPTFDGSLSS